MRTKLTDTNVANLVAFAQVDFIFHAWFGLSSVKIILYLAQCNYTKLINLSSIGYVKSNCSGCSGCCSSPKVIHQGCGKRGDVPQEECKERCTSEKTCKGYFYYLAADYCYLVTESTNCPIGFSLNARGNIGDIMAHSDTCFTGYDSPCFVKLLGA